MLSSTAFLAAATQCAASIHPSTAYDIASVESGFNPYAIAEILPQKERAPGSPGVISHQPTSREAAINITKRIAANGRRYSVGLMQITSTNFRHYGVTAEELFNPCVNLSVFERILTDCYRRGGSLKRALSCYYSGNFKSGQQPETAFKQTSYVQRIGYVVPSTHEELKRDTAVIQYPAAILRGDLTNKYPPVLPSAQYPNIVIRGDFSYEEK
ncbi:lytic transglycosylase domain-containing protein [Kosakonia sacchari]|uniref:Type IV secretion system protein VirB1 n=1 Tax=Kosakonia sacchari TaxID=1158459 RepID=A0A1G4YT97_9ENTR|nr:lytic transglycosylase domain-containing protein [Kosakonia sacchari]AHJ75582.1 transglycosylase [Kosakonia sacchari SP1]SCX56591.1 type IV secretion system protein VirB1 [Kosakonia sacchari]